MAIVEKYDVAQDSQHGKPQRIGKQFASQGNEHISIGLVHPRLHCTIFAFLRDSIDRKEQYHHTQDARQHGGKHIGLIVGSGIANQVGVKFHRLDNAHNLFFGVAFLAQNLALHRSGSKFADGCQRLVAQCSSQEVSIIGIECQTGSLECQKVAVDTLGNFKELV